MTVPVEKYRRMNDDELQDELHHEARGALEVFLDAYAKHDGFAALVAARPFRHRRRVIEHEIATRRVR